MPTTASVHRAFHVGQTPHLFTSLLPGFQTREPRGSRSSPLLCRHAVFLEISPHPVFLHKPHGYLFPVSHMVLDQQGFGVGFGEHRGGWSGAPDGTRPSLAPMNSERRAVAAPLAPFSMAPGAST